MHFVQCNTGSKQFLDIYSFTYYTNAYLVEFSVFTYLLQSFRILGRTCECLVLSRAGAAARHSRLELVQVWRFLLPTLNFSVSWEQQQRTHRFTCGAIVLLLLKFEFFKFFFSAENTSDDISVLCFDNVFDRRISFLFVHWHFEVLERAIIENVFR